MLQPKRTKFRKMHKGRNTGLAQKGNKVSFGREAFALAAAKLPVKTTFSVRTVM